MDLNNCSIIIAGLGRCGTTYLYNNFINYGFKPGGYFSRFKKKYKYKKNYVYKTHDYPPKYKIHSCKIIYLFGDPRNIVCSVNNQKNNNWWMKAHFYNLNSNYLDHKLYHKKDVLNLEKLHDLWFKQQNFKFLSIRYENLYLYFNKINEFINLKIKFYRFEKRKSNWKIHKNKEDIYQTYMKLFLKIDKCPDYKIWKAKIDFITLK